MKKFVTLLAASSIAMTMAATSFAKESLAPGQMCSGLTHMAKRNCMRGTLLQKSEIKMENKMSQMKRVYTKRQIKDKERDRQNLFMWMQSSKSAAAASAAAASAAARSSSKSSVMSSSSAASTSSASSASSSSSSASSN